MGRMHAQVWGMVAGGRLAAVVDKDPAKREKFSAEFGVPAFATLENAVAEVECQAVDICLPTHLHCETTLAAAKLGKHILCEKPMALTVEEADRMMAACGEAGVRLMIAHCIRFWPEYALLREIVQSGRLGKLISLTLTRFGAFPTWSSENWLADETKSGGGVLDMHIHDTDFALYLLGEPSNVVSHGVIDDKGPSYVFSTYTYAGGPIVMLEGGWNLPAGAPFKMAFRAVFERGFVMMDGGPMMVFEAGKPAEQPAFAKQAIEGGGNISDLGGYYPEVEYFVAGLASGEAFEACTPESSRRSLAYALEEIRQIKSHRA